MKIQDIYDTVKQNQDFFSEDYIYEYSYSSPFHNKKMLGIGVTCPMCEDDLEGEKEGNYIHAECENCGAIIHSVDEIIVCDIENMCIPNND